jgi:5-formyltetrahydrofolate cyclo-ligase
MTGLQRQAPAPKSELRRRIRQQRLDLPARVRAMAARRVVTTMTRLPWFRQARRVAFYLPHRGELDLRGLPLRRPDKQYFLPLLPARHGLPLWFAPLRPGTPLRRNRYGILEPAVPRHEWLRAARLDLVMVPLVAFDRRGGRLGMGGGYYDATLAFLQQRDRWLRPRIVGVAYAVQEIETLPLDPWDVPMMAIVTETGVVKTA